MSWLPRPFGMRRVILNLVICPKPLTSVQRHSAQLKCTTRRRNVTPSRTLSANKYFGRFKCLRLRNYYRIYFNCSLLVLVCSYGGVEYEWKYQTKHQTLSFKIFMFRLTRIIFGMKISTRLAVDLVWYNVYPCEEVKNNFVLRVMPCVNS